MNHTKTDPKAEAGARVPRRGRRPRKNTKANSPNIPRPSGELTSNKTQDHREDQARPGKKANYIIGVTKKVGTHTLPKMPHKHPQTDKEVERPTPRKTETGDPDPQTGMTLQRF